MKASTLTQLYWPTQCQNKEGYIIGWSIRGFVCCIITVLDLPLAKIENTLKQIGEKVEVLGIVSAGTQEPQEAIEKRAVSDIWFSATVESNCIRLMDLHCCGYRYKASAHIIFYDNSKVNIDTCNMLCPEIFYRKLINQPQKLQKMEPSTLQLVCNQINRCAFIEKRILTKLELEPPPAGKWSKSSFYSGCVVIMLIFQVLGEFILAIYNFKIPIIQKGISDLPIKSKLFWHLSKRLNILSTWELNDMAIKPKYPCPYLARGFVNDYLTSRAIVMQAVFDWLIGIFLLLLLHHFASDTLLVFHTLGSTVHIEVLKSEITWLMGLPAGFKPNEALDNTIGKNILILIDSWNYVTTFLTKFEPEIVQLFAIFGVFGVSFQTALLSDLVDFCTLHIHYIYVFVGQVYSLQIQIIHSLCRLIIGNKKNVLKGRIDKGDYSVDEILLGTLIFTGLIFLYPTIAMYYLCFVSIWLSVQFVQTILTFALIFLNHFPCFLLWAYFIYPTYFTRSVYFEMVQTPINVYFPTNYMKLHTQKVPISKIFYDFTSRLKLVAANLLNFTIIKNILLGTQIPKISHWEF
ncbi:gpi1 [Blepharisma stoltei]|uniref:Phosphatidylinositol N-acetylglucosaminyltransferase subunit Q n=1 Tax=Blepharisma stoltei TaxID=1481888 RepID=A0AAU9IGU7_9CILI|nr:unnamed protein product [Blepharisma stoltei]